MSETFKDFCLLSSFHLTVDIPRTKYSYQLYFNPTVFPVSNDNSCFYSFFQSVLDMIQTIIFSGNIHSRTELQQMLGLVWGLGYKLSISYFFLLFGVFFSFSCCLLILAFHERKKKKAVWVIFSITCITLTPLHLVAPFFSASFFKESSSHPTNHFHCQHLKSLLLLIHLFDAVTRRWYRTRQHAIR